MQIMNDSYITILKVYGIGHRDFLIFRLYMAFAFKTINEYGYINIRYLYFGSSYALEIHTFIKIYF